LIVGLTIVLVSAPAALGFAGHVVKITGPSSVKIGKKFTFKLSGFTGKFVNELVVLEATTKCVPTYTQEPPPPRPSPPPA
jgi:hypothetical protein